MVTFRNARELDRRVRLLREVQTQDPATGAVLKSRQFIRTAWARQSQLSGRDVELAASLRTAEERKYRFRYAADIVPGVLIDDGGTIYSVTRVHPLDRRHWIDAYARKEA